MAVPAFDAAVAALARGGIVAYPTEAVYGLGCDPANDGALGRLLSLKRRPADKGLILIGANLAMLEPWLGPLDAELRGRIEPTWPGPTTWLLPAGADCPPLLRGAHDTIAVRVTDHPIAAALCNAWDGALVSTSANPSGRESAREAAEVRRLFGDRVQAIVDGPVGGRARPTPILDARTGQILRE